MLDAYNGQLMFDKRDVKMQAMSRPERHTCCLDTVRNIVLAQSCCGLSTPVESVGRSDLRSSQRPRDSLKTPAEV